MLSEQAGLGLQTASPALPKLRCCYPCLPALLAGRRLSRAPHRYCSRSPRAEELTGACAGCDVQWGVHAMTGGGTAGKPTPHSEERISSFPQEKALSVAGQQQRVLADFSAYVVHPCNMQ